MRPISIRFQAFGPYLKEQVLEFSRLESGGLFLICGETGAGKTTILDAMSYALYNRSSGSLRGRGLEVMRCKLAGPEDDTVVEFDFACGGRQYRFRRSMRMLRKNYRDDHQCWELREGDWVPLFENPREKDVSELAERLLGLTYEQFRQVMLLPQGQFEKLLVSDSEEKEKILVSLFGTGRWDRIAGEIAERVKLRADALEQEKRTLRARLQVFGCDTPQALAEQEVRTRQEAEGLEAQCASGRAALEDLRKQAAAAQEAQRAFRQLDEARGVYDRLHSQKAQFDRLAQTLDLAVRAEALQPAYEEVQRMAQAAKEAGERLSRAQAGKLQAQTALGNVETRLRRHEEDRETFASYSQQLPVFRQKLDLYRQLEDKASKARHASEARKQAAQTLNRAEEQLTNARSGWEQAIVRQRETTAQYEDALSGYLSGIGSVLAEKLEPGKPCPVCGSVEHPAPARSGGAAVREEELEVLSRQVRTAADRASETLNRYHQAQQTREQAAQAHNLALLADNDARKDYELALEQRIPGIGTYDQLTQRIARTAAWLQQYEQETEALQAALVQAQANLQASDAQTQGAETEEAQLREQALQRQMDWQRQLQEAGFARQEEFTACSMTRQERLAGQERLIGYGRDLARAKETLEAQEQALDGQVRPDVEKLEQQIQAAEAAQLAQQRQLALKQDLLRRMGEEGTALETLRVRCERTQLELAEDQAFSRMLSGTGLSLQRYVLGVMLSSVTAEANRLLKNVYGGRYQLFRSQELGDKRRRGGLELEILDHANGQRRSVRTLSGGEKFLVALSLAIGLSSVVQAQGSGVRMEAMFIDEGFGSLDKEAVADALDILDGIRKGSGMVGIISHVEQLAETIPNKIVVQKSRHGSSCSIRA